MRKMIIFILASFMAFSLAACGSPSEQESTSAVISSSSAALDVTLEAEESTKDGETHFIINTNLPDETELMLTLSKPSENFSAQGKITVQNGTATSETFSNNGAPLSGDYTLKITMSLPSLQADSVRAIIGEKGENLTGQYVNKEDGTITAQFDCSFEGSEQKQGTSKTEDDKNAPTANENTNISTEQSSALQQAKSYLSSSAFSYDSLVNQLEYEGFSHADAVYAADNCGADWREQAVKSAASYLTSSSFSHDELVHQLEYEGFSHEDAVYAVDNSSADWSNHAEKTAASYLDISAFSHDGLVRQLEHDGYSHEDAVHAVDNCGADWNEQAVKCAQSYRDFSTFSHAELVRQLESEGFTSEQAEHGTSATE